ncbi:MAG: primosomal protein N' [Lentisphaeria bacterium]|nr:primosomal protein N' [Lentisphaeria bacterium]
MSVTFARVVVNLSLDRPFDYVIPARLAGRVHVGSRVRVPFGRGKGCRDAYVVDILTESAWPDCKEILAVEGEKPHLPQSLVTLAEWMADYYCCAREQAVRTLLPAVIRQGKIHAKKQLHIALAGDESLAQTVPELDKRAPKQAAIMHVLLVHHEGLLNSILKEAESTSSAARALEKKGLVTIAQKDVGRDPFANADVARSTSLSLTADQARAVSAVNQGIDAADGSSFLLHGVTGSGKTEVYLQSIDHCLAQGKQAIVLVPEISLTPQTCERFRARFGDTVCVLHSGLSDGERFDEWMKIHEDKASVVVGARSALFAPFRALGLIVVDEEHENTYKQSEAPRYNARDVAVVRGKIEGAAVVLGTATPAMESIHNCQVGKYTLLTLPKRVDDQLMPSVEIVDMREEAAARGMPQIISRRLQSLIDGRLDRGEQVILFLNRRGYASQMMCLKCGYVAKCSECSAAYTYHRKREFLMCHLCGQLQPAHKTCPACGDADIRYSGLGTEKVEAVTRKLFPRARVARMDSDTMTAKDAYAKTLTAFKTGKTDILIGTQMIAKGLHFPNVTLVGLIFADLGLHIPDFRAGERTFQLITQVAGRAGRGDITGKVIVQSYTPFHAALEFARQHDTNGFTASELEERKILQFPPYTHMALVHFRGTDEARLQGVCDQFIQAVSPHLPPGTEIIGPMPSPIARIKGKFRYQILLRTHRVTQLGRVLRHVTIGKSMPSGVDVQVDIDPLSLM